MQIYYFFKFNILNTLRIYLFYFTFGNLRDFNNYHYSGFLIFKIPNKVYHFPPIEYILFKNHKILLKQLIINKIVSRIFF